MKRSLIGGKNSCNSHWIRRISSRRGHRKLWGGDKFLFYVFGRGGK